MAVCNELNLISNFHLSSQPFSLVVWWRIFLSSTYPFCFPLSLPVSLSFGYTCTLWARFSSPVTSSSVYLHSDKMRRREHLYGFRQEWRFPHLLLLVFVSLFFLSFVNSQIWIRNEKGWKPYAGRTNLSIRNQFLHSFIHLPLLLSTCCQVSTNDVFPASFFFPTKDAGNYPHPSLNLVIVGGVVVVSFRILLTSPVTSVYTHIYTYLYIYKSIFIPFCISINTSS